MDSNQIASMASRALYMAMLLGTPLLIICLAIGVVISIFQATTQIHEQSLAFVPKLVAIIVALVIGGVWMSEQLQSFFRECIAKIARM